MSGTGADCRNRSVNAPFCPSLREGCPSAAMGRVGASILPACVIRRRGRRPRRPAHRLLTRFVHRRTGRCPQRSLPPDNRHFPFYRTRSHHATPHGRTHGSAPTGDLKGYPIQPTLNVVATRVAGDGDPYGEIGTGSICRDRSVIQRSLPPLPPSYEEGAPRRGGREFPEPFRQRTL